MDRYDDLYGVRALSVLAELQPEAFDRLMWIETERINAGEADEDPFLEEGR